MSEQTLGAWRETFDTNVFGLIETTKAFLPLLRKSEAGRIVNLSSILGSIALHAKPGSPIYDNKQCPAYNVSKAAVNAYTVQLAYELKDTKIKVNAAHPGWVKTEMGGEGAVMELEDGAKTSVALATLGLPMDLTEHSSTGPAATLVRNATRNMQTLDSRNRTVTRRSCSHLLERWHERPAPDQRVVSRRAIYSMPIPRRSRRSLAALRRAWLTFAS